MLNLASDTLYLGKYTFSALSLLFVSRSLGIIMGAPAIIIGKPQPPALRLFNLGTKRVLGISEQRFAVPGFSNVPEEITSHIDQAKTLIGDYVVCPFTHQRRGEMQMVCIEKVSKLEVRQNE